MVNPIENMLNQSNSMKQQPNLNGPLPTSMDDPRMNAAKEYVNSHGGNPKAAFLQLCKEKMLNPVDIINSMFWNQNGR